MALANLALGVGTTELYEYLQSGGTLCLASFIIISLCNFNIIIKAMESIFIVYYFRENIFHLSSYLLCTWPFNQNIHNHFSSYAYSLITFSYGLCVAQVLRNQQPEGWLISIIHSYHAVLGDNWQKGCRTDYLLSSSLSRWSYKS